MIGNWEVLMLIQRMKKDLDGDVSGGIGCVDMVRKLHGKTNGSLGRAGTLLLAQHTIEASCE
jgi:hypothetical protein